MRDLHHHCLGDPLFARTRERAEGLRDRPHAPAVIGAVAHLHQHWLGQADMRAVAGDRGDRLVRGAREEMVAQDRQVRTKRRPVLLVADQDPLERLALVRLPARKDGLPAHRRR
jgi:hypothetical protein